ncbi:MAG: SDR family NAD(P)-dependent oxidoreductase [Myxococcales bacterium]
MSRPHPFLSWLLAPRGLARLEPLRRAVAGRVVLVTGASFGIGEALALRLGAAGAKVVLAARTGPRLAEVAAQIASAGGAAEILPLDLTDSASVARAAVELQQRHGAADVIVHNAGKSIRRSLALSLNRFHDFQRTMAVNYLGPVQLQLALLPGMIARRSGHIVNVSTVGARLPPAPRWAAYHASKVAFDLWIRSAAPELHHQGLACTSIYLGLVHTRMSAPSAANRTSPGQSPDEAADVVCRALVRRPRSIGPWWLAPVSWLAQPLARPVAWAQERLFPYGADTPAARGERT